MKVILSFDIGGDSVKYGYGTPENGLLFFDKIEHSEKTGYQLKKSLDLTINKISSLSNIEIDHIVIGIPGVVKSERKIETSSCPNLPEISTSNLINYLKKNHLYSFFFENDANLMALGEATDKSECFSLVGITLGSGIGAGLVLNGKIYKGADNAAMELGHTTVVPNGRKCKCGKKGCLEAYFSLSTFSDLIAKTPGISNIQDLFHLSRTDKFLHSIVYKGYELLGLAVSNIVQTINPNCIIVGGGISEIPDFDLDYISKVVYSNVWETYKPGLKLSKAKYGNKAGIWGGINYHKTKNI